MADPQTLLGDCDRSGSKSTYHCLCRSRCVRRDDQERYVGGRKLFEYAVRRIVCSEAKLSFVRI
jgi:hypothetical protein